MDSNDFFNNNAPTTDKDYAAKHSQSSYDIMEEPLLSPPPVPLPLPPAVRPAKKSGFGILIKILISVAVIAVIGVGLALATKVWNPSWNPVDKLLNLY